MQVLVPIAGKSAFFDPKHYYFPKPLIEVAGRPMVDRVVGNLATLSADTRFIFVAPREDVVAFSLDKTLELLTDGACSVVTLGGPTRGALCSALMAVEEIDLDAPLIVANGDQVIGADLSAIVERFVAEGVEAGVITFDSVHPRWSYVRCDASGAVVQAAEKQVISRHAIAGFYYFKTGQAFVDAAMRTIRQKVSVNGDYFIAPCLNEIILAGGTVAKHAIASSDYHSFFSPEKIRTYEDRRNRRKQDADSDGRVRVIIPAAGQGSRFQRAGYPKPKPFLDVDDGMMIERVIDNVSVTNADIHILLRTEHVAGFPEEASRLRGRGWTLHPVASLTEGTACTLLLARASFDDSRPLLVANSDQYVEFSVEDYVDDCMRRNLDGSILVFRDPTKDPKWSFARVDDNGLVLEVAEKKPISDLATVGIYLFRRGSEFVAAAVDMIARNERVNNEFYTCPVYNYMIKAGLRIGVYEIPPSAMHGLGTPEDLEAFLKRPSVEEP